MKKLFFSMALLMGISLIAYPQVIDFVGTGSGGLQTNNVGVPDISNIDKVIVGAIYWSGPIPPVTTVAFTHNLQTFAELVRATEHPEFNKSGISGFSGYFQHTFTDIGTGGGDIDAPVIFPVIYSVYAYIYRDLTTPDYYSIEDLEHVEFYINCSTDPYVYSVPILTSTSERDITVKLGISQLNAGDDRYAVITYTAGSVSTTIQVCDPNKGDSFYLDPVILANVPGNITSVEISIYSPCPSVDGEEGDSFITNGVVVDVDMGLNHCTFTKGFWGNKNGKDCDQVTTKNILNGFDLATNPLFIGKPGHSLTINSTKCVLDFLPGGGKSKALGDDFNCSNEPPTKKNGQLKNGLLTQTIALSLNLRYDPSLGVLPLKQYVITFDPEDDCDPFSDPDGGEKQFEISADVIAELGINNSINDLLELANMALGKTYTGNLSLSEINDAVTAINEGFDECRVLGGFYEESQKSSFAQIDNDDQELAVYPNPVSTSASIEFTAISEERTVVEVYNLMGVRTDLIFDGIAKEGVEYGFELDVTNYPEGMYIVIVKNGNNVSRSKISVLR